MKKELISVSKTVTIEKKFVVSLTVKELATAFAGLDDEQQAQFFIDVASEAAEWKDEPGAMTFDQWYGVGRHLRTCECSTDAARDLVMRLADGVRG